MTKCPNCGRKTYSGDYCQWCHYPLVRRRFVRQARRETQFKRLAEQAELTAEQIIKGARERAKKEAEEEVARILAGSKQRAEQLAEEIKGEAKREAEQIVREVIQEVKKEARGEWPLAMGKAEKVVKWLHEQMSPSQADSFRLESHRPEVAEKVQIADKIRVFAVDRDLLFRQGLHLSLSETHDIQIVGESEDFVEDTVLMIEELASNVVLVDIDLLSFGELDLVEQIIERLPTVPVIVLAPYEDDSQILEALKAGATGYLSKDTTAEELASAVRSVFKGERIINDFLIRPKVAQRVLNQFQDMVKATGDLIASLSPEETEILGYFANGYSCKQVTHVRTISDEALKDLLNCIASKLIANERYPGNSSGNAS